MTSQRALVTGGSRGIGAAIAHALASSGHSVAVHCRAGVDDAHEVVKSLSGNGHGVVVGDIASPDAVQAFVGEAVSLLGGVDVLVNNAGVYFHHPIADMSYVDWLDAWRRTLDINLHGPANVTWCVVDHLLHRPEGPAGARVINVGSRGAYRGEPDAPAYGASKAALHSLTQSLAVSLGSHGIAVAGVAPGFVDTEMAAFATDDSVRAQSPFNRVASPAEIASAVAWLASPSAEWASGAIIDLNGASYLR